MTNVPPIAILLATFNGGRHLRAQLDSLLAQSHSRWRLVVSDDGSSDDTRAILDDFAAAHPGRDITITTGPRQGATRNFLRLVGATRAGEWLAFCDQDDVWLPDRLARGAEALIGTRGPAVHAARTVICDDDLRPLTDAPLYTRPPHFLNALVQACLPGNTTLANPAAAALMRAAAPMAEAAGIVAHDWWTYQIVAGAGGTVRRDPARTVLYRQHAGNVMGRNDTWRARLARLARLGAGDYGAWLHANQRALSGARELLAPEHRATLDRFGTAIASDGPGAALRLMRLGVYRQTRTGTAALMAAAAAGRLKG